jgi:hypothetical protein
LLQQPSRLERLVIRPGESGWVLTYTEFELAKFCKTKKRKCDYLYIMKKRAFAIEDIRADSIWEIEKMIRHFQQ